MIADTLLLAQGDVEWGYTLLIVDWGAALGSLAFLAIGLFSYYAARHPERLLQRGGGLGLVAGTGVAFLFSAACGLLGGFALFSGNLPTPNGEALIGMAAYAGGAICIGLAALMARTTWRHLRTVLAPSLHRHHGGGFHSGAV